MSEAIRPPPPPGTSSWRTQGQRTQYATKRLRVCWLVALSPCTAGQCHTYYIAQACKYNATCQTRYINTFRTEGTNGRNPTNPLQHSDNQPYTPAVTLRSLRVFPTHRRHELLMISRINRTYCPELCNQLVFVMRRNVLCEVGTKFWNIILINNSYFSSSFVLSFGRLMGIAWKCYWTRRRPACSSLSILLRIKTDQHEINPTAGNYTLNTPLDQTPLIFWKDACGWLQRYVMPVLNPKLFAGSDSTSNP
jgi:hypothetical protein